MAVSQPRPPDRVDAALEKVAPLRYLEAHECARAEQAVTRYYLYSLSLNSFLSYKSCSFRVIEDTDVSAFNIQRYVHIFIVFDIDAFEANRYLHCNR